MSTTDDLFQEPPERLRKLSLRNFFAFVGPGLIIASVTIGSGELVWASRSGAIFGYSLLWCFLVAGIFKGVQVYVAARHLALTGEHPLVTWKGLPGPPLWFPLLIALPTLMVMPIGFSSIAEILGGYLRELTGISSTEEMIGPFTGVEFWENVWGGAVLTLCFILAIVSPLNTLERVSAVVLRIDYSLCRHLRHLLSPRSRAVLTGLLIPTVPEYDEWVLADFTGASTFSDRKSRWKSPSLPECCREGDGRLCWLRRDDPRQEMGNRRFTSRFKRQLEQLSSEQISRAKIWTRAAMLDVVIFGRHSGDLTLRWFRGVNSC
ncbi:MAG: hypothetical protein R3C11_00990 [Planctomycetaceae bacterium]